MAKKAKYIRGGAVGKPIPKETSVKQNYPKKGTKKTGR
jgi:hypothetical protein